ncbi:hypothetical protein [Marinicella marina]|uniref:hypothetical protein n=1 Tax=Marinicella marina TaxID=2996016 RepID=UPI0024BD1473|nr:hypothetical protein [Marinicella marina]MDJ1139654.1 hypothetical protein [Marinicella marina]
MNDKCRKLAESQILMGMEGRAFLVGEEPITTFTDENGFSNMIAVDDAAKQILLSQDYRGDLEEVAFCYEDLNKVIEALVYIRGEYVQSLSPPKDATIH